MNLKKKKIREFKQIIKEGLSLHQVCWLIISNQFACSISANNSDSASVSICSLQVTWVSCGFWSWYFASLKIDFLAEESIFVAMIEENRSMKSFHQMLWHNQKLLRINSCVNAQEVLLYKFYAFIALKHMIFFYEKLNPLHTSWLESLSKKILMTSHCHKLNV